MRQDRICWYCGKPETVEPVELHHVEKRSLRPDRVDDKTNLMPLCATHHRQTETSHRFLELIKDLWQESKRPPWA